MENYQPFHEGLKRLSGTQAFQQVALGLVSNANHTGDATGSTALTLATVNLNAGSFTNASVTVNAKGLVTAASNGSGGGGITIGTTAIASGTSGRVLYNNAGVVGELTTTGSGTVLALANNPTFTGTVAVDVITASGSVTVNSPLTISKINHSSDLALTVENTGYLAGSSASLILNSKYTNGVFYPATISNAPISAASRLAFDSSQYSISNPSEFRLAIGLPTVTGQSGKYLTTDGTAISWGVVDLSTKQNANAFLDILVGINATSGTGAIARVSGPTFTGDINIGANSLVGAYSGVYNDGKWLKGTDGYGQFFISPFNAAFAFSPPAAGGAIPVTIDYAGRVNCETGVNVGSGAFSGAVARYYYNGTKASIRADGGLEVRNLAGSADGALTAGAITTSGAVKLGIKTIATLPSAASSSGERYQVSDSALVVNRIAFSNGSAWYYEGMAALI